MAKHKSKQKILVIDDSPVSLTLMESALEECGARVFLASNAQEARSILHRHDIALIYLDIMMPDILGYDFAKEIHARPRCRYVPIIFITALKNDDEDILRSYKSGVVDILKKPVEPEIIKSKTRVFLQLDSQRRVIEEQQRDLKTAFKRLQDYAQHDQLTGLFNREQITNILARLVSTSKRKSRSIAVMFLDLDHFKVVNDSYGHSVGDLLLRSTALRLKGCVRDIDYVARLGGDEFCIVLTDVNSSADTSTVANRIIDALAAPHFVQKHEIFAAASIGIAMYDGTQNSANVLLKNADAAMYLAKNKGRNQFAYFSQELEEEAMMRIELGAKLKHAIENKQLMTYYQPQYGPAGKEIIGFEALLRWELEGTMISPILFISIAEESGLINDLGLWVMNDACAQLKYWQEQCGLDPSVTISVNVSSRQLAYDGFISSLESALETSQISPQCLELELTETAVMSDPERCADIFTQLQNLGIKVSVDDFGTGYSSLSYLSALPLDALKIDRSFVSNIIDDKKNQSITKAIIGLSHSLGLKVVAEGVETIAQQHFLMDNGCDAMQGFLLSKPLPAKDIEALL
ncbi:MULTISPECIES: bifunctional diguanylate cyclase/phosphodiesterase [unclassified Oleiphilus]|nr:MULTISPECIES: EAL domain-containing protein [unclassified Oleiphilus]KZY65286.1 hypothetical protein A3738_00890 [Oleiphilus sp. HI0066]KZY68494.1 hypothetical protein A3739_01615 [Oleiphilus sp. HI0067]MCH2158225.1 EAL domain-containing protein [Oleiphilaceae bacterium]